jgi:RNA polymerase sigma factor (sigma-70 family)
VIRFSEIDRERDGRKWEAVDPDAESPDSVSRADWADHIRSQVAGMLTHLPARYQEVVRLYFGIDCERLSLGEIGKLSGITRSAAGQTLQLALRKLRERFPVVRSLLSGSSASRRVI